MNSKHPLPGILPVRCGGGAEGAWSFLEDLK